MARTNGIRYDADRVMTDMAVRGWMVPDLARAAGVASNTIRNFLSGKFQTAKTNGAIARAMGYSPRRYLRTGKAA